MTDEQRLEELMRLERDQAARYHLRNWAGPDVSAAIEKAAYEETGRAIFPQPQPTNAGNVTGTGLIDFTQQRSLAPLDIARQAAMQKAGR